MKNLLDDVAIASPCTADWNQMVGDDRRRFCTQCQLHVHDLSAMTAAAAEAFLRAAGTGRRCVRLFRRADGRVLTRDCPVGLRRQLRLAWSRAAALGLALWSTLAGCVRSPAPAAPVPVEVPKMGECWLGDVAAPPAAVPSPAVPPPELGKVRGAPSPEK